MEKMILVDGSSLLSTSFFGLLPKEYLYAKTKEQKEIALKKVMKTSDGIFTNGVYAMTKSLMRLIQQQKPKYMAIAWDVTRNTFRKALYEEYKAHRKETAPELKSQFQLMQRVLDELGISQFKSAQYEADDYLGSLAKQFNGQVMTFVLTKDQDSLQLINDTTHVWLTTSKHKDMYSEIGQNYGDYKLPNGVFEHTVETIKYFYELDKPSQIIDMKAIEGDKSDNIPGVAGVGSKTVIPLLKEFGTVENLYDSIEPLDKEKEIELKKLFKELGIKRSPLKKLIEGKAYAYLSKQLATINCDIEEVKKLELNDLILNINEDNKVKIFKELEFSSLL